MKRTARNPEGETGGSPVKPQPPRPATAVDEPRGVGPRLLAVRALAATETDQAQASRWLNNNPEAAGLSESDRALLTSLVLGSLRLRRPLDQALRGVLARPIEKLPPELAWNLRLAAFQLLEMRIPAYAAVNSAVEITRQFGQTWALGFTNGALRKLAARAERDRAAAGPVKKPPAEALPDWLIRLRREQTGETAALAWAAAAIQTPPLTLRVNLRKGTRDGIAARLLEEGVHTHPCVFSAEGLTAGEGAGKLFKSKAFAAGLCAVQDEAAQLVCAWLPAFPDGPILDACAAPGGKTTHLAERFPGRELVAVDRPGQRMALLSGTLRRMGASHVRALPGDLLEPVPELARRQFALVLLDAPCSGLGAIRRHPESLRRLTPEDLPRLAAAQSQLLERLAPMVEPGGLLAYVVCSDTREETTEVVNRFLKSHPLFQRERFSAGAPELISRDGDFAPPLAFSGMDAFYGACLRRRG
ncbi:MAG: Ribosomal RNA small subunit methyltransferase B [Myxococcota bacterium]|nr:Ribosomal RNA small subunit methyltransferase B [Myxococcota bacterium]